MERLALNAQQGYRIRCALKRSAQCAIQWRCDGRRTEQRACRYLCSASCILPSENGGISQTLKAHHATPSMRLKLRYQSQAYRLTSKFSIASEDTCNVSCERSVQETARRRRGSLLRRGRRRENCRNHSLHSSNQALPTS